MAILVNPKRWLPFTTTTTTPFELSEPVQQVHANQANNMKPVCILSMDLNLIVSGIRALLFLRPLSISNATQQNQKKKKKKLKQKKNGYVTFNSIYSSV